MTPIRQDIDASVLVLIVCLTALIIAFPPQESTAGLDKVLVLSVPAVRDLPCLKGSVAVLFKRNRAADGANPFAGMGTIMYAEKLPWWQEGAHFARIFDGEEAILPMAATAVAS